MWWTPTPYASVFGLWLVVIMGLTVWFGTTAPSLRDLYKGLAVGGAVSSAVAVLQHFGMDILPSTSLLPSGLYVNSVQQGTVLALIAVALASERKWFWILPLLPGIALSGSRGAWVALAVGLIGCHVRRVWVFGAVIAAGVVYMLLPLSPSDAQRTLIWATAWHNTTLFGWGPGVFYTILIPQGDGSSFYPEHAHSDALQLFFEYGVAATLPLAIFVFALCRTEDPGWPIVLAFATAGCYSMPLYMPITSFIALSAVGGVLRNYGMARSYGGHRGQHVVSWRRSDDGAGWDPVPVAPRSPRKGW